ARYGKEAARQTPPIARMLEAGVPVGAGTDATRVSSYNPWVALYWLVSGKTLGGLRLYPDSNLIERAQALQLWTQGSAWFSGEADVKGAIKQGQYADLAVLSADFMQVNEADIQFIESVLTITGGRIVYGAAEFDKLSPPLPPASPAWSPVNAYHGAWNSKRPSVLAKQQTAQCDTSCSHGCNLHGHQHHIVWNTPLPVAEESQFWGALGCSCFAF
ncbi:MAG: amidohydrolase family protein, partial [Pseudomonadota bacterium]